MRLIRRVAVVEHLQPQRPAFSPDIDLLREPRHRQSPGSKRNLRALVEKDRRMLLPQNLFRSVLVVQPPEPDFGLTRQSSDQVRLVQFDPHARKAKPEHLRPGIVDDRSLDMRKPKPEDGVSRPGSRNRPESQSLQKPEGLGRSRTAEREDMLRRSGDQIEKRKLLRGLPKRRRRADGRPSR